MSDDTNTPSAADERAEIENRCNLLGIPVHPNAKNETLLLKIRAKLAEAPAVEEADKDEPQPTAPAPTPVKEVEGKKVHPALALTRCIITCNDPQKAEQSGDVISASNSEIGDVRFYFHFNKPWHVPKIILDTIYESKMFLHSSRKDGTEVVTREVPRYNVQILPPLDEKQRERIAAKQAAALATED